MDTLQVIVLALVQGLTEFLPISSSAHLILVPVVAGWPDQGLAFDVAVHVGTLIAVVAYFRDEVTGMLRDWLGWIFNGERSANGRLAWAVLWATVPVGLAGLAFKDVIETELRSPLVIAWATIGFGVLLLAADWVSPQRRDEHSLRWTDVLFIGCSQALALIPGTSRSGITMTAGLLSGLTRSAAARFSFLLSIPAILLPGGLKTLDLIEQSAPVDWVALSLAVVLSALSAYLCIHYFLRLLERVGMLPFVLYRLALGGLLLYLFTP